LTIHGLGRRERRHRHHDGCHGSLEGEELDTASSMAG
jgi:hypothetical protein